MGVQKRINALVQLGKVMTAVGSGKGWIGYDLGMTQEEFSSFEDWVYRAKIYNGWFEELEVRRAFSSWGEALTQEHLEAWLEMYTINENKTPKTVAIIMAGNIPMVGLHDLLCVYLSGNKALIKLSSDDDKLIPALLKVWGCFDADINDQVEIAIGKMEYFDAVIATGSNNSARYFEQYFGKYPHVIRKNRTSVAILDGTESTDELKALAEDVFAYYGLGCRNVTKLYLPKDFDLNKVFGGLFHFSNVTDNKKYGNNYDYHKAIFLLEGFDVLENGFILLKQDEALTSPIGTLYYEYYDDRNTLEQNIQDKADEIQCIVSHKNIPFGDSQKPQLWDYADNVDTMKFLLNL